MHPKLLLLLSTREFVRDSSKNHKEKFLILLQELMLIKASLNNLKLLMESLTFSWFLTTLLKEPLSQLTFMWQRILQRSPKMQFLTLLTLFVSIITTGLIQLRFLPLACWQIRQPFIEVKLEIFLPTLTFISCLSSSDQFDITATAVSYFSLQRSTLTVKRLF